MSCNTVTEPFLVADPDNNGLKCGPSSDPINPPEGPRLFKFANTTADGIYFNVDVCKDACAEDPNCVAMSLGFGSPKDKSKPDYWWCIGCSEELAEFEAGRQGHEGDHRASEGGAATPSRRARGLRTLVDLLSTLLAVEERALLLLRRDAAEVDPRGF